MGAVWQVCRVHACVGMGWRLVRNMATQAWPNRPLHDPGNCPIEPSLGNVYNERQCVWSGQSLHSNGERRSLRS